MNESWLEKQYRESPKLRWLVRWEHLKFYLVKWFWHWPKDEPYWNFPTDEEPYLTGIRTGRLVEYKESDYD